MDYFEFDIDDAVFDSRCVKDGALLLFEPAAVSKIGGMEYDKALYQIIMSNIKKIDMDLPGVINEDATKVTM